ncbi:MAG: LacI family DNA-binding transcriptional regulator [Bacteroidales bacterium]|nr:LacI family DNA-binding transcriptional regulator [Bacteroidales bacterium]
MAIKKVTIRDVAREAGVSVTLVSFVMNAKVGKDGRLDCPVNPKTAARVLEVAKRLGYRKNNAAASLRSGHSRTIALIVPDIANPFYSDICRYLENIAYKADYTVLFASSDESWQKLGNLIDTVIGYNVEGLIVAPCTGCEPVLDKALSYNIPIILIDRNISGDGYGRVMVNNEEAGRQAAKYLIDKGLKKIEMLTYSLGITSLTEREKGYREAMREAGLEDNANVHPVDYDAESARNETVSIVQGALKRGVEAFFLPTKALSMCALYAARVLKRRIPDDLSFVCYDESDIFDIHDPVIPHIIQPLQGLAEESFKMLRKMIEGEPVDKFVSLNSNLVLSGIVGSHRTPSSL